MKITLCYYAQIRAAAGRESETVEYGGVPSLAQVVGAAAARHGDAFRALVATESGAVRPSVLILVNGLPADRVNPPPLKDGDTVSLMSAVAGG